MAQHHLDIVFCMYTGMIQIKVGVVASLFFTVTQSMFSLARKHNIYHSSFELQLVNITLQSRDIVLANIYRPPSSSKSLFLLFKSLCERHFSILPTMIKSRRIDKIGSSPGAKPSRLLVQLGSEAIASEVLAQARQLRHSDDDYVKLNVYVSRDMSPEEAKLAYEERSRRRLRRLKSLTEDSSNTLPRVDENYSSDILSTGVTNEQEQRVPVPTVASAVPSLSDPMQFPPMDSHCLGALPFQDKQLISNSSQWCPPGIMLLPS